MPFTGDYVDLELSIISQLNLLVDGGVEVVQTPDTDLEKDIAFEKPRVTIMYINSKFGESSGGLPPTMSTAESVQMEYAQITCNIQSRSLRGSKGVHAIGGDCKKLLLGFRPDKVWGRLFLDSYTFAEHKDNVWYWVLTFACSRTIVQPCPGHSNDLINTGNSGLNDAVFGVNPGVPLKKVTYKLNINSGN